MRPPARGATEPHTSAEDLKGVVLQARACGSLFKAPRSMSIAPARYRAPMSVGRRPALRFTSVLRQIMPTLICQSSSMPSAVLSPRRSWMTRCRFRHGASRALSGLPRAPAPSSAAHGGTEASFTMLAEHLVCSRNPPSRPALDASAGGRSRTKSFLNARGLAGTPGDQRKPHR